MKQLNQTIHDLIRNENLSFLVGAGCSSDFPSCLPTAPSMMEIIIRYTCPKSESKKLVMLIKKRKLRFEQLIEIVRDHLDKDLKVIDYYEQCESPNKQHFFYAEMIKKGHFVMTTNFDFLIEHVLFQLGVSKEEMECIITKKQFEKYFNPNKLYKQGKKVLYKIHGSTKDIVKEIDTRNSLIATIRAFGLNKQGLNTFQIEPYKKRLFVNITKRRTLVIVGYSGSDDFDIVPALKAINNIKKIIWINHSPEITNKERVYEILSNDMDEGSKINRILIDIRQKNNINHIYRVDINTTSLIERLIEYSPKISKKEFKITPLEWLEKNISSPSTLLKYNIASDIYFEFNMLADSKRCSEKILQIAIKKNDLLWEGTALNNIGEILKSQGNLEEALIKFKKALNITEKLGNINKIGTNLNNIATIYFEQGKLTEAMEKYEEALRDYRFLPDLEDRAIVINNLGQILYKQGNYLEAKKRFKESLDISESLGDLKGKANSIISIAVINYEEGKYSKALIKYGEAIKIFHYLGDLRGIACALNNISLIYFEKGNYFEALKKLKKVLKIQEEVNDLKGISECLNNISNIHLKSKNYTLAWKYLKKALNIDEKLGNLDGIANQLSNLGRILFIQGKNTQALKKFDESLKINQTIGNLKGLAIQLNNIGEVLRVKGDNIQALRKYKKALKILEKLGDKKEMAISLNNVGLMYYHEGEYFKALKSCKKALKIMGDLKDDNKFAAFLNDIGMIFFSIGEFGQAYKYLGRALKNYKKLKRNETLEVRNIKKYLKIMKS